MSKKGKGKGATLIAVIVILAVLGGFIWFLEKGLSRRTTPVETETPRAIVDARLLIKGCLFDLGIQKDQAEFYQQTIQVRPEKRFSHEQLSQTFAPLERYGRVTIKNNRAVRIKIDGETWEVEFFYPPKAPAAEKPPLAGKLPPGRIAIIVDDMGVEMKPARQLGAIDGELTFSVMPQRPNSQEVARYLHARGRQILLHLPMQGNGGKDPGQGAIYKDMTPDHIRTVLALNIRSVPYIAGVNNHMGSEVTPQKEIMRQVLKELQARDLFFIDSLTTSASVASDVAQEIGLEHNTRDIFLDNEQNEAYIMGQLAKLKAIARKHSSAIAICHPYPETIAVLTRAVPKLKEEGITLVPVSTFVQK